MHIHPSFSTRHPHSQLGLFHHTGVASTFSVSRAWLPGSLPVGTCLEQYFQSSMSSKHVSEFLYSDRNLNKHIVSYPLSYGNGQVSSIYLHIQKDTRPISLFLLLVTAWADLGIRPLSQEVCDLRLLGWGRGFSQHSDAGPSSLTAHS